MAGPSEDSHGVSHVSLPETSDDVDLLNGADVMSQESGGCQRQESNSVSELILQTSKRKRSSSTLVPPRLTRSMSSGQLKHDPHHRAERKGKAKAEDEHNNDEADESFDSVRDNASTSSGASAASRMLQPGSQSSSRAASIVSSAPSTQPSPTLRRQISNAGHQRNPLPLLHTHGLHRHHPPPFSHVLLPQSHQHQRSLIPSQESNIPADTSSSLSSPAQRAPPVTSSPVTRSNCRFHKISLPREEGGPRVCFLVPGCSLGDRKLMAEQEIEDHGDAAVEDSTRMIADIESLDFSSYLIGILRQLVGVDLLREQEVYYLPQPGELRHRKARRKLAGEKSTLGRLPSRDSAAITDAGRIAGSPRAPIASARSPTASVSRAPTSAGGSTSTSGVSIRQKALGSENDSFSLASWSDDESSDANETETPESKRRRKGAALDGNSDVQVGEMLPPSSSRPLKPRRSKRSSIDSIAFKPEPERAGTDSSDENQTSTKIRRKRSRRRGVKRSRGNETLAAGEVADSRGLKRRRKHPGSSAADENKV